MKTGIEIRRFEHEVAEFMTRLMRNPIFWAILVAAIVMMMIVLASFFFPSGSAQYMPYQPGPYHLPPMGYPY